MVTTGWLLLKMGMSASPQAISTHLVTIIEGGGHVTVRAITVRIEIDGTSTISNPSPNSKKVFDVPPAPFFLSGPIASADNVA